MCVIMFKELACFLGDDKNSNFYFKKINISGRNASLVYGPHSSIAMVYLIIAMFSFILYFYVPVNNFVTHVRINSCFPGLRQYYKMDNVSC